MATRQARGQSMNLTVGEDPRDRAGPLYVRTDGTVERTKAKVKRPDTMEVDDGTDELSGFAENLRRSAAKVAAGGDGEAPEPVEPDDDEDEGPEEVDEDDAAEAEDAGDEEGDDEEDGEEDDEPVPRAARAPRRPAADAVVLEAERERREALEAQVAELRQAQNSQRQAQIAHFISEREGMIKRVAALEVQSINEGRGADAVEARNLQVRLQTEINQAQALGNKIKAEAQATPAVTARQRTEQAARAWNLKNPWFNPDDNDNPAVRKAVAAYDRLVQKGVDPATKAFWSEMDVIASTLAPPEPAKRSAPRDRPSVRAASGGSAGRSPTRTASAPFTISPARAAMLRAAGIDTSDKATMKRAIANMKAYDAAEAPKRRK